MLAILALWLLIVIPVLPFGLRTLGLIDPRRLVNRLGDRILIAAWLGCMALSLAMLGISLTGPLNGTKYVLVAAAMLLAALSSREVRQDLAGFTRLGYSNPKWAGVILLVAMAIATYASRPVTAYDTGLYHYQNLKWQSEYGLVPGLALIHQRFGFITSWFSLPAVFEGGILEGRTTAIMGAAIFFLAAVQWLIALGRWVGGTARAADHFCVVGLGLLLVYIGNLFMKLGLLFSPSPDVPMAVLPVLIAWSFWLPEEDELPQLPLLLAIGALTLKLSALPLLLVTAAIAAHRLLAARPRRPSQWSVPLVAGMLAAAVIVAASVVVTGCGLYPAAPTCLHLPWSIDREAASEMTRIIIEWARWKGPAPEGANALNWIPKWIRDRKNFVELLILFSAAVWLVRGRLRCSKRAKASAVLCITGLVYAGVTAPDLRFGAGYLFILPGVWFALIPWFKASAGTSGQVRSRNLAALFFSGFVIASLAFHMGKGNAEKNWLLPAQMRAGEYAAVEGDPSGRIAYFRPIQPAADDRCWAAPLPCAPGDISARIRYRDSSGNLAHGFELQQLQKTPD